METPTAPAPLVGWPRAVHVQLHTPVDGQSYKAVTWRWRPLGPYLAGVDGKLLEFDSREEAESHAAD